MDILESIPGKTVVRLDYRECQMLRFGLNGAIIDAELNPGDVGIVAENLDYAREIQNFCTSRKY